MGGIAAPDENDLNNPRRGSRYVGVKTIASLLGRTPQWVYDQVALGEIPHHKVGHYLMFDEQRVLENYPEIGGRS